MSKQTAVEWLEFEINRRGPTENNPPKWLKELYEQAKAMEIEQIKTAWCDGNDSEPKEVTGDYAEQYYQETYGGDK